MRRTRCSPVAVAMALTACGCAAGDPATAGSTDGGASIGDGTGGGDGVIGLDLLPRLSGLWAGPVSMTPLGDFPTMNMDVRPASGHVLFSRVDLDARNSLRFAFSIETHDGRDVLVYRNGGLFGGLSRDSRTSLVERDGAREVWRFCSVGMGCDYIDATFDFDGAESMLLDVKVRGEQHVWWTATRAETRTLPQPFPVDETSQGEGDAPFSPMPELRVTVGWTEALAEPADVWVLLATTPCGVTGACTTSRFLSIAADTGATSAVLLHEQIHAGEYLASAILDRNRNLAQTVFPDAGDAASVPDQAVTVAPEGTSETSLFVIVEL